MIMAQPAIEAITSCREKAMPAPIKPRKVESPWSWRCQMTAAKKTKRKKAA
ncbi:hypothetical protein D3C72_2538710 [compost metagenome]